MIESPLIREIEARGEARGRMQAHVEDILRFLEARFEQFPEEIRARLARISDEETLERLVVSAARCRDLAAFRAQLPD
jgi:hypothetical protein